MDSEDPGRDAPEVLWQWGLQTGEMGKEATRKKVQGSRAARLEMLEASLGLALMSCPAGAGMLRHPGLELRREAEVQVRRVRPSLPNPRCAVHRPGGPCPAP